MRFYSEFDKNGMLYTSASSRKAVRKLLHAHIKEEKFFSALMRKLLHIKKPFSMIDHKTEVDYIVLGNSYKKINQKNK